MGRRAIRINCVCGLALTIRVKDKILAILSQDHGEALACGGWNMLREDYWRREIKARNKYSRRGVVYSMRIEAEMTWILFT